MKVLVVGSGAREHALCWALRQSPRLDTLYCAPGNAGTARLATTVPIRSEAVAELAAWADSNAIDLTIVGPEAPLAAGLVDALAARGRQAFGPSAAAAEIEASKCWSWAFRERHSIPSPRARACSDLAGGLAAVEELGLPVAVKADGLAAGKGVVLAQTADTARRALTWLLEEGGVGAAGQRVLLEECLSGPELSVLAFSDGRTIVPMPPARDYKRIGEGDLGPNTGGMGAYSRPSFATPELLDQVRREVLEPTVRGMAAEGRPFVGVLYAGLMLTRDGPKVLEFNCRFGDPETQVILPLLDSDLLDAIEACVDGRLRSADVRWKPGHACGIVLASEGYPGSYPTGREIHGLDGLSPEALVFQAGTATHDGRIFTAGGRVLTTVGVAADLEAARGAALDLARRITFEGCYHRTDVAADDALVAFDVQRPTCDGMPAGIR